MRSTPRHDPPLVLVVDDEADLLELTARRLRRAGLQAATAPDGETGWQLARQLLPDAAVLDVRMPGIDGLELARRLRAEPALAGLRIVLLTASVRSEEADLAFGAGADAFVRKPCTKDELLEALAPVLAEAASS